METTLLLLAMGLLFYQALIAGPVFRAISRLRGITPLVTNANILYARLLGFFLFGALAFYSDGEWPFKDLTALRQWANNLPYLFTGAILILCFMFIAFRNEKNRAGYPQLQFRKWTSSIFLLNVITWGVYLFSYEWLWRGSILRLLTVQYSQVAAVIISTIGYSLYHLFKSKREAIGAIPMGLLLGYLSIRSSGFLPAFLLHWIFAIGSEAICLYYLHYTYKNTELS